MFYKLLFEKIINAKTGSLLFVTLIIPYPIVCPIDQVYGIYLFFFFFTYGIYLLCQKEKGKSKYEHSNNDVEI